MNEQLTKQLQAFFSSVSDVDLVYLFGSRVDADIGPMSDYDLGVLVSNTAHPEAILSCLDRGIKSTLGIVSVDLVLLGDAPVELAYAIIAQGVCVYQKDITIRIEFEARILSMYDDYLPVLRAQRENILRGGDDEYRVQRYREALGRTERTLSQIRTLKKQIAS